MPAGVTSVEKRAVRDAALKAGAKEAYLIEEPLAAAIGANVPISGPSGNMIIDIGGGTSEIAVIALGGIVVSHSLRVGGNQFDEAIATYIRKKYNLMVGERTAEEVKIQIGTALPLERELTDGGPRPRPDRRPAAHDPDHQQRGHGGDRGARSSSWSPRSDRSSSRRRRSCRSDIIDKGMVMSGGGALLRNVDKLLTQVTGVPCHVAENPLELRRARAPGSPSSTSTSSRSRWSSRSDRDGPRTSSTAGRARSSTCTATSRGSFDCLSDPRGRRQGRQRRAG